MANTGDRNLLRITAILVGLLVFPATAWSAPQQRLTTRTLRTMSRAYLVYGQYDKARTLAERAAAQAWRDNVETGELAMCMIDLGTVYSYENMLEDAAAILAAGIVLQKQAIGEDHPYVAHTLRMLGDVCRRQGKLDAAEAALDEAFSIMLSHAYMDERDMTPFVIASAELAAAAGQYEESRNIYNRAQQMLLATYGPNHLYTAQVLQGAAETSLAFGELQEAREQINRSMELQKQYFSQRPQMLIAGWLVRARIERACGEIEESEATLQKAIAAARQSNNVVTLARVYEQVGAIRAGSVLTASAANVSSSL